jgi:hypothetical protein
MKIGRTLEEEWQSYFTNVLAPHGISTDLAQGMLRNVFFSGAGSLLVLLTSNPAATVRIRDEILAFHAKLYPLRGQRSH